MKYLYTKVFFAAVLLFLGSSDIQAQETAKKDFIKQVEEALKSASSKELSKFLHNRIDLKLEGKRKEYSVNQAEIVLKDFFQRQPSSETEFIHDGNSAGGMIYAIGTYKSGNISYRIMIRAKKYKDKYKVYHLEFTQER